MNRISDTEAEKLLKDIEQLLNPIRKRASHIAYGTGSTSLKEPSTQFTMNYKGFEIKVIVK